MLLPGTQAFGWMPKPQSPGNCVRPIVHTEFAGKLKPIHVAKALALEIVLPQVQAHHLVEEFGSFSGRKP